MPSCPSPCTSCCWMRNLDKTATGAWDRRVRSWRHSVEFIIAGRLPTWLSQSAHSNRTTSAVRGVAPAWRAKAALPRRAMAWAAAGSARVFRN